MCKKRNCKNCTGFDSPWVCNCGHPWSEHTQGTKVRKMVVVDGSGNSMEYEDTDDLDYQVTSEFQDPGSFAIVTAGDATLSIETVDGEMSISIFPNPTSSILNVNFDGELYLSIHNMLGQQILETNDKQIDFSGFEKGTYILVVQNLESGNTTNFKIIKE